MMQPYVEGSFIKCLAFESVNRLTAIILNDCEFSKHLDACENRQ